jgi:hypothetical protein
MRVIVTTCDTYLHALRPFAWLFNRYWGDDTEVIVGGFSTPDFELPSNFTFHSIGKQEDYPVDKWSDAVIKLLHEIEDEVVCLMLEDYWLARPVNRQAVRMLHDYMIQFKNVLKMDLGTDRLYAAGATDYGHCGYIDLIHSDPGSQYHCSLMGGLWRRDLLLRFLIPGETPWQVELEGTPRVRAAAGEVLVLGTRQAPVRHILAHRRGDPSELLVDGLAPSDVQAMADLGYFKLTKG